MDLIQVVESAVEKAERGESKLVEPFPDKFTQYSLSGYKGRALINNICSSPGIRYLEVGSYAGSTFCSALCGNQIDAVAVDLWEQFIEQPRATIVKNLFIERVKKYRGQNSVRIFQENIYDPFTPEKIGQGFNFYFFDGDHTAEATESGLLDALYCMKDEFIWLVDDYAMISTKLGVEAALCDDRIELLWSKELGTVEPYDWYLDKRDASKPDWWCNYFVAVLRKKT